LSVAEHHHRRQGRFVHFDGREERNGVPAKPAARDFSRACFARSDLRLSQIATAAAALTSSG
jgi:hypothetical protein